jgi:Transposase DDE domain
VNEIEALNATPGVGNEKPLQYGSECNQHLVPKEVLVMEIVALFCDIDDFCLQFEPLWQQHLICEGRRYRCRGQRLCLSEVMTIMVSFHQSGYRTFKDYYLRYGLPHLCWAFPQVVSYTRFVELMAEALIPLCAYLQTRKGRSEGVAFIDSTLLAVCHPKRSGRHKVFAGLARWGRNSLGWGYGFKLHLLINDVGELLACRLTVANVDDRVPVPALVAKVQGKVFGDRGYISQALFATLFTHGVQLITKLRKDMKNKLLPMLDKLLLRKRSLIETVNDQLKNISQIEHSRHRSVTNFLVNLVAGLIAYTYQPKKPSLHIRMPQDASIYLAVL